MTAPATPAPPVPVLEPAAQRLAEETDPHPRIYELPLDQARALFDQIQSGDGVARPSIDEEWVEVDAGEWGTVRARIVRPKNATGTLPVFMYIHGGGWVLGDSGTHDRLVRELVGDAGSRRVVPGIGIASAVSAVMPPFIAALALEIAPVRANAIAPGFVDTPLSASVLEDQLEARRTALTGATYDNDGGQQFVF